MPISRLDEFLAHQTPYSVDQVFTSDRNFYDRHYFNCHDCRGDVVLAVGLGQYPNLGVTDAFATVSVGDEQYTVRASRDLGADRLDTAVGPLAVEVLDPLVSLRVRCDTSESPLAFDLVWSGATEVVEEPRIVRHVGPRLTSNTSRYTQVGTWSGRLTVGARTFEIDETRWWGARDRSWGIRPVGEPEPPGIGSRVGRRGSFHNWIPMQFENYMIKVMLDEDHEGNRVTEEAARVWNVGTDRASEYLGHPVLEPEWIDGTREIRRARLGFHGGDVVVAPIEITPLRTVYLNAGSGYVFDGRWCHGAYQGPLVVEALTHSIASPDARRAISGLNQTLCRFEIEGGDTGYGLYENMFLGAHIPSGFGPNDESLRGLRG